jgi:hypothetical protein
MASLGRDEFTDEEWEDAFEGRGALGEAFVVAWERAHPWQNYLPKNGSFSRTATDAEDPHPSSSESS